MGNITERPFWVVWNQGAGLPMRQHASNASASAEAERLARGHPGSRFYVLQALRYVEINTLHIVELDSECPF